MKLTKTELKQIVQEEVEQSIEEGLWDQFKSEMSGYKDVPGAIRDRARHMWDEKIPGKGKEVAGSIRGPQSKYAQGKASKILTIHRQKFIKNMKKAIASHRKLTKDFRKDIRDLGLHGPKAPAAEQIKDIKDQLTAHKKALVDLRTLAPLFKDAIDSIQAGPTPQEAEAPDDIPELADAYIDDLDQGTDDLEIAAGPDPDAAGSTEDVLSRADAGLAAAGAAYDETEAQMAARAKRRAGSRRADKAPVVAGPGSPGSSLRGGSRPATGPAPQSPFPSGAKRPEEPGGRDDLEQWRKSTTGVRKEAQELKESQEFARWKKRAGIKEK